MRRHTVHASANVEGQVPQRSNFLLDQWRENYFSEELPVLNSRKAKDKEKELQLQREKFIAKKKNKHEYLKGT